jgi:hypothetical protein
MLWWSPWWLALYVGVVAGAVAYLWRAGVIAGVVAYLGLPWVLAAAVGGGVAVGLVALWALWWRLPKWQMDRLDRLQIIEPKDRANIEDNFRKTVTQIVAGAAVLIAAAIAYNGTLQTNREARDLLISQQVSKGFEDLGSEKLVVRLGGIYALEGVMNTSEQYHQPTLEALCASVRDNTKDYKGDGPPATDIQAALTVIGRRKAGEGDSVDLAGAHIPKAAFPFKAPLGYANLTDADLRKAILWYASLYDADLTNANLSDADLSGARLSDAHLNRANLTDADLGGAFLEFAGLTGAHLNRANLRYADLIDAVLRDANLTDADLRKANLWYADLTNANLSDADLTDTNVTQDQLDKACGNAGTKLPPKLTIKHCPPDWHQ